MDIYPPEQQPKNGVAVLDLRKSRIAAVIKNVPMRRALAQAKGGDNVLLFD